MEPAEQLLLPAAARRAFTPLHNVCVFAGGRLELENKGGNLVAPKSNIMINEGVGREPGEQGQPYNLSRIRQMANIHIITETKQKQKIP